MTTPLSRPCDPPQGVRLGAIEVGRLLGLFAMIFGVATGGVVLALGLQSGELAVALAGAILTAAASTFDLIGEAALVRLLARRFERRGGSLLRAPGNAHVLVNVEPEATVASLKRVPDDIAVLEVLPRSGRLVLEGVQGRAEIRAEAQPTITARRDQLWPVVTLRYDEDARHFDLVLYQQPSFVRFFDVLLGLARIVRHPSDRLAARMRLALDAVQLPGRNVPDVDAVALPTSDTNAWPKRS